MASCLNGNDGLQPIEFLCLLRVRPCSRTYNQIARLLPSSTTVHGKIVNFTWASQHFGESTVKSSLVLFLRARGYHDRAGYRNLGHNTETTLVYATDTLTHSL
jgi:hypothetical protein